RSLIAPRSADDSRHGRNPERRGGSRPEFAERAETDYATVADSGCCDESTPRARTTLTSWRRRWKSLSAGAREACGSMEDAIDVRTECAPVDPMEDAVYTLFTNKSECARTRSAKNKTAAESIVACVETAPAAPCDRASTCLTAAPVCFGGGVALPVPLSRAAGAPGPAGCKRSGAPRGPQPVALKDGRPPPKPRQPSSTRTLPSADPPCPPAEQTPYAVIQPKADSALGATRLSRPFRQARQLRLAQLPKSAYRAAGHSPISERDGVPRPKLRRDPTYPAGPSADAAAASSGAAVRPCRRRRVPRSIHHDPSSAAAILTGSGGARAEALPIAAKNKKKKEAAFLRALLRRGGLLSARFETVMKRDALFHAGRPSVSARGS
ncbi:hypothetical protein HPB47_024041, partial [Ixodes persulcatus]